jgi:hypothetical protein
MVSQNGRTASTRPRSGSLAYLDAGLDQVLGSPLRLATSTKRRIVLTKLPDVPRGETSLKMTVSLSETLFLVPSSAGAGVAG